MSKRLFSALTDIEKETVKEVLVKCPKCKADVISGQRFCTECGTEQELKMKTKEEILEMKERIEKIAKASALGGSPGESMGKLMLGLTFSITADSCFKWVLGLIDDQKLVDTFKLPNEK